MNYSLQRNPKIYQIVILPTNKINISNLMPTNQAAIRKSTRQSGRQITKIKVK
jgi:hypothetical protein